MDYGIMAATFINLETSRAFRVISTEESRYLARRYTPHEMDRSRAQLQAYQMMPDRALFRVQEVQVDLTPFDLPGPTRRKVTCVRCGQVVRDQREVMVDGQPHCRPCAGGAYFRAAKDITWEDMDWSPLPTAGDLEL